MGNKNKQKEQKIAFRLFMIFIGGIVLLGFNKFPFHYFGGFFITYSTIALWHNAYPNFFKLNSQTKTKPKHL